MKNVSRNQRKREIENQAKEWLKKLSKKTKNEYAKKEKTQNVSVGIISLLLLGSVGVYLIIYDYPYIVSLLGGILLITMGIINFLLFAVIDSLKTIDELALRVIKRELKHQLRDFVKNQDEDDKTKFLGSDFLISKEISILASDGYAVREVGNFLIDNTNKKFIYKKGKVYSKTFNFSDIISYEVYENGKSQVQGRAGAALIGGAFFGLAGAVVGSSMSRNISEKCNQLKLIIRLNDFECPQIVITYVDYAELDKLGVDYRCMKKDMQALCSMLEFMLNEKTLKQSSTVKQEELHAQKSSKEQLQELKELLDDGLITQEDFEQKKKQILGL